MLALATLYMSPLLEPVIANICNTLEPNKNRVKLSGIMLMIITNDFSVVAVSVLATNIRAAPLRRPKYQPALNWNKVGERMFLL